MTLRADNERLEQELALLREELRLKDACLARLPAREWPHFPPVERLAILELRAASTIRVPTRWSRRPSR